MIETARFIEFSEMNRSFAAPGSWAKRFKYLLFTIMAGTLHFIFATGVIELCFIKNFKICGVLLYCLLLDSIIHI